MAGKLLRTALPVIIGLAVLGLLALGTWQVQRLLWKNDLVARIDARIHAAAVAVPDLSAADPDDLAYLHVTLTGTYLPEGQARAYALTERGAGDWVMTPLRLDDGRLVYVNRGFVPTGTDLPTPLAGQVTVSGLLRTPELDPPPFRTNQPAERRWYNRDIAGMAAAAEIGGVEPMFVDADRTGEGLPVGGMTQVNFTNNHLIYALTWYGLAALLTGLVLFVRKRAH